MIDKFFFNICKDNIANFNARGFFFDHIFFEKLDIKIRSFRTIIYRLQYKSSCFSNLFKFLKFSQLSSDFLLFDIFFLKDLIKKFKVKLSFLEKVFNKFFFKTPNLLHKTVFLGFSESDNVEIRIFNFNHCFKSFIIKDIESNLNYIDFKTAAKISGSGFVVLKSCLAQLYRSIGNYMLDLHIFEHKYKEIHCPLLVKEDSMFNTGHFPKFLNDQFLVSDSNMWLIPTAEVVLANIVSNSLLDFFDLPIKFVSKTSCFRKEKGNYGSKVRGLIRQHQFDKVELVNIVLPDRSYDFLEELLYHAEKVLQNLCLPYRVISLCSYDTGFSSSKTYDIEAWYPKRKMYIEVSSCSNTENFQSFRMKSKIFLKNKFFCYPHILNGSGLAIGRVFLAIIENYSDSNGNLIIPDVLVKYMNGKKIINF